MVFFSSNSSRRSFLKWSGLTLASLPLYTLKDKVNLKIDRQAQQMPNVGLQLISVNDELIKNPKETLQKISYIGFAGLETPYNFGRLTLKDYSKLIKKSGLEVFAIHAELPLDNARKDSILERVKAFDCKRIIWHGLPEDSRFNNLEGVVQLANTYNRANQFARSNGLSFGIQNHWWEFEKLSDGRLPFDLLFDLLDEDIFFELDVYWIAVTGQDPVEVIRKVGPRAPIIHVKDGPGVWTPRLDDPIPYPVLAVGTGSLDYPAILEACQGTAEWIVVDIEACETDIIQAVFDSYRYLTSNNYAKGLK